MRDPEPHELNRVGEPPACLLPLIRRGIASTLATKSDLLIAIRKMSMALNSFMRLAQPAPLSEAFTTLPIHDS